MTAASPGTMPQPTDSASLPEEEVAWISEVRRTIRDADTDFFAVSPTRYWIDFLVSLVAAYLAAAVYLSYPFGSWQQLVAFPIAAFGSTGWVR